jgi:hypothetical protein
MNIMKVITAESYTYTRRPVKLVFIPNLNEVELAEDLLKTSERLSRSKEAMVNDNWEILPDLSKNSRMKNERGFDRLSLTNLKPEATKIIYKY